MNAFVYILQSLKNGEYYIGSTEDVVRRLAQHNAGSVLATRYKKPYKLVFSQEFDDVSLARRAERKIKSWKRRDFIEKVIKNNRFDFLGS